MHKIISVSQAAKLISPSSTIMIGGFLRCGSPYKIIQELVKNKTNNLTLIANDTSCPGYDRGLLISNHLIKKAIVAHIGTNPETVQQMNDGKIEIELLPMGTLIEKIRCGGAGLGGFLTPTGVGTLVEKNKQVIELDGKKYLLETPLRADVAIVYATKADKYGNAFLEGTTRNFNPVIATAADTVILEPEQICDTPLDPSQITIPGIFVDYIAK